jgi:hypothetical protein
LRCTRGAPAGEAAYHDPDGSAVTRLHSEQGRLVGPAVELSDVAVEVDHA